MLAVDENDELIDTLREPKNDFGEKQDFAQLILENLKTSGIQQAHKEDKINFTSIALWPGEFVCAEGRYMEGETESRAGIFIGPEFGTVAREDLLKLLENAVMPILMCLSPVLLTTKHIRQNSTNSDAFVF